MNSSAKRPGRRRGTKSKTSQFASPELDQSLCLISDLQNPLCKAWQGETTLPEMRLEHPSYKGYWAAPESRERRAFEYYFHRARPFTSPGPGPLGRLGPPNLPGRATCLGCDHPAQRALRKTSHPRDIGLVANK
ncbi:uncharacterized protein N7525_009146 [Penicillium rubens]|uniref:uncharacterized protein n=1 Tax=Penicillium rubens TaxID=1108849 RepID=UPI002A5A27EB|nr:uncharacterized protein N7525_009146 [Penicillium rubens]KAJ5830893.1 hypothetical protein N7525_009146 [Penicillium rubens]